MPACIHCEMLVDGHCTAHDIAHEVLGRSEKLQPPPLGACMIPIARGYLGFIRPGMRVLEIGCGCWNCIRAHCESVGAGYEGIDVQTEYLGVPTVATRIENLAELSFPDELFDVVVGNQTMEHWAEFGCRLRWGLYQCFRVCKPGGRVLLNVPIHFHGSGLFVLGELDKLRRLFAPFSSRVQFEAWGRPSAPLPDVFPRPGYWRLRGKPAYVLDIQAVKDRPLPGGYNNRWASQGRLAQLLVYPVDYNLYRIFRRLGAFSYVTEVKPQADAGGSQSGGGHQRGE
jgi:SAM-dependent methyltransferase